MATKFYEFDLWAARDKDECIFSYLSEPKKYDTIYGEQAEKYKEKTSLIKILFSETNLTEFEKELNITNINEPYKFKAKLIFEGLPDNSESDSINNQKQEIMPENNQTPLEQAKAAVHFHSDCKLLTKEEYEELCKYKGLYLDLKGSVNNIMNQFKDK